MDLLQKIVAHAKSNKQRIVLPEATEERTLKAADRVLADDIADIILIGNPGEISRLAQQWGLSNIQPPSSTPRTIPRARCMPKSLPRYVRARA